MQQGGGSHSHYGGPPPPAEPPAAAAATAAAPPPTSTAAPHHHMVVEEASPISSRPPAPSGLDEFLPLSGGDMDALAAAAAADVGGSSGGGGGNRWPRQETLELLRIRSEMDAAFRDATLKGPLWEDVSRKLGELGYRRSAKKCKEKFENVHKYYKRTKEGRAGRQDGKTYKFFSELEALHNTAAGATVGISAASSGGGAASGTAALGGLSVPPVSIGISFANPVPISTVRGQPPVLAHPPPHTHHIFAPTTAPGLATRSAATAAMSASPMGMIFSSNSSSSSGRSEEDDDDEEDEEEGEPSTTGSSRKRKRGPGETSGSGGGSRRKMMELFEGLMRQVMQKQEEMQKRFFEAIEKREQDRLIREEAWRRQEMNRLARENEIAAQERAASASRDAAIVSFLQKITGQTIHLPTMPATMLATVTTSVPPLSQTPLPKTQVRPTHAAPHPQPPMPPPPTYQEQPQQQRQNIEVVTHPLPASTGIIMAVPEQQVPPRSQELILSGGSGGEPSSSSRWPKVEVIALIKLRSGLESRYQEAGPKGPLWEEISAGMARMGYKRSAKRCKEKWENINKYFKKVKESNKKRPEDAKTCPYFHELDALYRKKELGGGGGGATSGTAATSGSMGFRAEPSPSTANLEARPVIAQDQPPPPPPPPAAPAQAGEPERKDGGDNSGAQERTVEEGNGGSLKKPEDTVKELIGQGQHQNQHLDSDQQHLRVNSGNYNDKKMEEGDSDNIEDQEENELEEDDEENEEDEELEEERKMAYKIEFQRPNASAPPNGGGNGAPSFLAMVQ